MLVTPFCWHFSNSDAFIAREAPVMSGCCSPTPPQNSCMPPPVPVDSTNGPGNSPARPKYTATAAVHGNTVEEPHIVHWLRDWAFDAHDRATVAAEARRRVICLTGRLQNTSGQ